MKTSNSRRMTVLVGLGTLIFGVSCAKISTENLVDGANLPQELLPEKPEKPLCEYDPTEFLLNVNFQSFEFSGNGGVSVGYNGPSFIPVKAGVKYKSSRLFLDIAAVDAKSGFMVDSVNFEKKATDWKFSLEAILGFFGLSLDFGNTTPVAKIIRDGLSGGIANLTAKMALRLPPFRTVISKQPIASIEEYVVPIGYPSNLKEGDQLKVYNVDYAWSGTPCAPGSDYEIMNKREAGIVEVTNSRIDRSTVKFVAGTRKEAIKEGAIVELYKLGGDKNSQKRKLMRMIRVNQVTTSGKLIFEGRGEIDLPAVGQAQLNGMLSEVGFYKR